MSQQYRNIFYVSDRSGTAQWRLLWPLNSVNCISQSLNIQADYSQTPIVDQNYYTGMNSITVQRWISTQQKDILCKFFKPLMDANSGWVRYEEDDAMFDGTLLDESKRDFLEKKYGNLVEASIPLFNRGRKAFEGKEVQQNIKDMLNAADLVTVTTDYLKEYYHDFYDVPYDNIIALPNLLPRYLFDDRFDANKKTKQFAKNKSKPRIGIVSSLSHFNIDSVRCDKDGKAVREQKKPDGTSKWVREDNVEVNYEDTMKITDDFDDIAQCIRDLADEFQFVCFGYAPPQIKDLVDSKKVEFHGGTPIMQYPSMLEKLQLQAVVAPIKKIAFNFSKSFIKFMECSAIGMPLFATNCLPYDRVMPKEQLFDTQDDLKAKLIELKYASTDKYKSIIEAQWRWLNSPCREGDYNLKNFWMEDNLQIYIDLLRLRQKTLPVSLKAFITQYEARKAQEVANTIFKNNNIAITK